MKDCECSGCLREADTYCRFCGKDFCSACGPIACHGCWKSMAPSEEQEAHRKEDHETEPA